MTLRKPRCRPRSGAGRGRAGPPSRGRRAAASTVWLFGRHAVAAALANPERRCHRLIATEEALAKLGGRGEGAPARPGLAVERVPRAAFAEHLPRGALPPGAVHQGIALAAEPLPSPALDAVCAPESKTETGAGVESGAETRSWRAVVMVLDQVTDPQNLGACLRAAAAFGARAVVVPDRHSPRESGALARAASGALDLLPLVRVANLARALDRLKRLGYWCEGLDAEAPTPLAEALPVGPLALVLGAEGAGLRRLTRERCDGLARLPIANAVESLNVAAAAAVALYVATRECAAS